MDFSLAEEQRLLEETLNRFAQKEYAFEKRRAHQRSPQGYSREVWKQFADMGVLGLPFPEGDGGFGGGPVETMIVMQAIGRALMVEPYLATVVLGGGLVAALGGDSQKPSVLPAIAAGTMLLALAHGEPQSRYRLSSVRTAAKRDGGGWVLEGRKSVVLAGGQADELLVSARSSDGEDSARGISVFLVERGAAGVSVRDYRTVDGLRAADIELRGVRVGAEALLGREGEALPAIEAVADLGAAALCAEAVGVMESLNAQTLEYIKARNQFGQPIGRFQVLQHKAVDMMIHHEQSKSMALLAAMKSQSADPLERARACAAAKVHIGRSGRFIAETAVQLHGGMGMADEMPASHYAKRLTMIDFWLGDAQHHLDRYIGSGRP